MFKNFRMKLLARKRKKDALKSRNNLRSFHKRMDEVQSVKMKKIQENNLSQSCHMSCVESIILYQSSYEKKGVYSVLCLCPRQLFSLHSSLFFL